MIRTGGEGEWDHVGIEGSFVIRRGGDAIAFHASGEGFGESLFINRVSYPVDAPCVPSLTAEL